MFFSSAAVKHVNIWYYVFFCDCTKCGTRIGNERQKKRNRKKDQQQNTRNGNGFEFVWCVFFPFSVKSFIDIISTHQRLTNSQWLFVTHSHTCTPLIWPTTLHLPRIQFQSDRERKKATRKTFLFFVFFKLRSKLRVVFHDYLKKKMKQSIF